MYAIGPLGPTPLYLLRTMSMRFSEIVSSKLASGLGAQVWSGQLQAEMWDVPGMLQQGKVLVRGYTHLSQAIITHSYERKSKRLRRSITS